MIELYKQFCKEKEFTNPGIIPRVYDEEETLKDILSSIYGQSFRAGKDQGFDEGLNYIWDGEE